MKLLIAHIALAILMVLSVGCSQTKDNRKADFEVLQQQVKSNLATFDKLDFD